MRPPRRSGVPQGAYHGYHDWWIRASVCACVLETDLAMQNASFALLHLDINFSSVYWNNTIHYSSHIVLTQFLHSSYTVPTQFLHITITLVQLYLIQWYRFAKDKESSKNEENSKDIYTKIMFLDNDSSLWHIYGLCILCIFLKEQNETQ